MILGRASIIRAEARSVSTASRMPHQWVSAEPECPRRLACSAQRTHARTHAQIDERIDARTRTDVCERVSICDSRHTRLA
mmetsp:Transcript_7218/g.15752  ORF Transcript_7218/g.15752 Transcript_7218/m.15752 type:complete len:80 (-) Transcript_7218:2485-2724(-)